MAEKKIPYEQALSLSIYMSTLAELGSVAQMVEQRLNALRQPLIGFAKIASIPLDRADLKIHMDKGPNRQGLILIEWEDDSAPSAS